ncbi:MAG TPA: OPT/YSL family transporter, partial [Thermoanaerobaculia bacterium]|nr:OPT/YSL family transporter [Thermoanaerobaculia bacterium]
LVSVSVIGLTIIGLHNSAYGPIGDARLPAPQGTLMAVIIKGVLSQDLPWGFIFVGAALAVVVQLCGVSGLAWAVGAYLPISTTFPIFIGGVIRWLSDRIRKQPAAEESELSSGMLFSTGLVAGGAISGLLVAVLISMEAGGALARIRDAAASVGAGLNLGIFGAGGEWSALFMFAILCVILLRRSLRKLEI